MSGRSGGTATGWPSDGARLYQVASCLASAIDAFHARSVGAKAPAIGIQRLCARSNTVATPNHATGRNRGPNRRVRAENKTIASRIPANSYGNSNLRLMGIHHCQVDRHDVIPSIPAAKTHESNPNVSSM